MTDPLTEIARLLGITRDEAGRMTWQDLVDARARLEADRDAAERRARFRVIEGGD